MRLANWLGARSRTLLEGQWLVRRALPSIGDVANGAQETGTRPLSRLSPREIEVLETTVLGLTNLEIGRRLNISVHGVKFHLSSIYRKLGVANRTEAATMYLRDLRQEDSS